MEQAAGVAVLLKHLQNHAEAAAAVRWPGLVFLPMLYRQHWM
jgi:hypothetical protein